MRHNLERHYLEYDIFTKKATFPRIRHSLECDIIAMWNKHVATKQGEHKTNNLCEGYNRAFSISVPDNATVWAIVDLFKAEEATAKQSIIRAARGEVSPEAGKSRSLARIATEEQLLALVNNYHNISLSMFMESMIYFFDK